MKKLNLEEALACSLNIIEADLAFEIISISRVMKLYGSNANSFLIKCITKDNKEQDLFIKFEETKKINDEIRGIKRIQEYLPTPKLVLSSTETDPGWVCTVQIEGNLLTENYINATRTSEVNSSLIEIEKIKENHLVEMYNKTKGEISFSQYLNTQTNQLFYKRITGDRINDFYTSDKKTSHNILIVK